MLKVINYYKPVITVSLLYFISRSMGRGEGRTDGSRVATINPISSTLLGLIN